MGKLKPGFVFTGSLGNLSAYEMKGVDGLVLRTKGGASKEDIETLPVFERTRQLNAEFGGRAKASKWVTNMLWPQQQLADYNIVGPINSLLRSIQSLDTESKPGQRHIALSKQPRVLEGFSLNKKNSFDSTVRNPLSRSIDRDRLTARVEIPALVPGINLFAPPNQSMYSIIVVLGLVPDLFYNNNGYAPSTNIYVELGSIRTDTGWFPLRKGSPACTLELQYPARPADESFSMILSIGIRYGMLLDTDTVEQSKNVGAAKVLAMA